MKKLILLFAIVSLMTFKNQAQTVTDIDGNVYHTLTIGTQVWMVENLKTTKYRNGDLIGTTIPDTLDLSGQTNPKYQWSYNGNESNVATYGRLYTWYVVNDNRHIAPIGWHIPSDNEWTTLINYLGGDSVAGGILKNDAFAALMGGDRNGHGQFFNLGGFGEWWSATEYDSDGAWWRLIAYCSSNISKGFVWKKGGYSVRCIRDSTANAIDLNYQNDLQISPNPAMNRIFIDCNETQDFKLEIYSMIGQCVLKAQLGRGKNEIDIGFLLKGIYIIRIIGSDFIGQEKIIKE